MNRHSQNKHSIPLSLLISLFLHLLVIMYIVMSHKNTSNPQQNPLKPLSRSDNINNIIEWVEINAHNAGVAMPAQQCNVGDLDDHNNEPVIEKTIDTQATAIEQQRQHPNPLVNTPATHKSLPSLSQ